MHLDALQSMRRHLTKLAEDEATPLIPTSLPYQPHGVRDALRHGIVHAVANPVLGSGPGAFLASMLATPEVGTTRGALVGAASGGVAGALPYGALGYLIGRRYGRGRLGAALGVGLGVLGGGVSGGIAGSERAKELAPYTKAPANTGLSDPRRGINPGESIAGQDPRGPFFGEVGEYVGRNSPTFSGVKGGLALGVLAQQLGGLYTARDPIARHGAAALKYIRQQGGPIAAVENALEHGVPDAVWNSAKGGLADVGARSLLGRAIGLPIGAALGYHFYKNKKEYELGKHRGEAGAHSPSQPYTKEELAALMQLRDKVREAEMATKR